MMEKLPRQVYTSEFRQQAVEMVTREGLDEPQGQLLRQRAR
jgi:transposase-like protein